MPLANLKLLEDYKTEHYGISKDRLDICFMAQKYTKYGQDKGYDVFVEVAKILNKKYDNIYFHVVGSFDKNTIDVSQLKEKIKFHGILNIDEFDDFFIDKDIILSPNIPNKLANGSFDGFPTGSCVEAGLRKTAIFCTDELNLNRDRIINNKEIVLIPHNATEIVDIINKYYNSPVELKQICENGQNKLLKIFSYDNQIKPRIEMLKDEINKPFELTMQDKIRIKSLTKISKKYVIDSKKAVLKHKLGVLYRDYCPTIIKKGYKLIKKIVRG